MSKTPVAYIITDRKGSRRAILADGEAIKNAYLFGCKVEPLVHQEEPKKE